MNWHIETWTKHLPLLLSTLQPWDGFTHWTRSSLFRVAGGWFFVICCIPSVPSYWATPCMWSHTQSLACVLEIWTQVRMILPTDPSASPITNYKMCVSSTIHLKVIKYFCHLFSFELFVDFPDTISLNTLNVLLILPENILYDSN